VEKFLSFSLASTGSATEIKIMVFTNFTKKTKRLTEIQQAFFGFIKK
jgi:hypothetical protein